MNGIWKIKGGEIDVSARPAVMGILNATPDSFSDGGAYEDLDAALRRVEVMASEGADIIDIGGESTRPDSTMVSADEEIDRVAPIVEAVSSRIDIPISVDTWKIEVAKAAIGAGASIVNDISGLRFEPGLADIVAKSGAGLVLMHSRGDFETMHSQPPGSDILENVSRGIANSVDVALAAGVNPDRIAIDPGVGFGKSPIQNVEIIRNLGIFRAKFPELPILLGVSRKSFVGKLAGFKTSGRMTATIVCNSVGILNGASIIRVHDVREGAETAKMMEALLHDAG